MENKREDILRAAEIEFIDKGLDGARTTRIAERAGVTHAMLHYYFKTKQQLFEHMVQNKVIEIQQSVLTAFALPNMSMKERIIEGASRHFDFCMQNPHLPKFLLTTMPKNVLEGMIKIIAPIIQSQYSKLEREFHEAGISMSPAMMVSTIISLNMTPFLLEPLFTVVSQIQIDELTTYHDYLLRRKAENIRILQCILEG